MSSDTLIDYKDDSKGFWIQEPHLQIVLHYILEELKKPQYTFVDKPGIIDRFEFIINGYMSSYLVLPLDILLKAATDEQEFIRVLQQVKLNFRLKDSYISVAELQSIPTDDMTFKWVFETDPYLSNEIVIVIDALIEIVSNTWQRGIERFPFNN